MARRLIAAIALFSLGASACADDPSLELASLVDGLPVALLAAEPTAIADVECTEPVAEIIAQELSCTALLHEQPITIDVVVDETGAATSTIRETLFDLAPVEIDLAARLVDDLGIHVAVECPGTVIVLFVGEQFVCTAMHDDRPLVFTVEIVDGDGNWTVDLSR